MPWSPAEPAIADAAAHTPAPDPTARLLDEVSRLVWQLQRYRPGEDYVVRDGQLVMLDRASGRFRQDAQAAYRDRVAELGMAAFTELERQVELAVIDASWRKHLADLTDLTRTVETVDEHARLHRYQLGATAAFQAMRDTINREVIRYLFNLEVQVEEMPDPPPAWRPPPALRLLPHRRDWKDRDWKDLASFRQRLSQPPAPKPPPPPPAVGPLGPPLEPPPHERLEERDT